MVKENTREYKRQDSIWASTLGYKYVVRWLGVTFLPLSMPFAVCVGAILSLFGTYLVPFFLL